MKQLLRFEFHKLFRAKVLYIAVAAIILIALILIGTDKLTEMSFEAMGITVNEPGDDALSQEMGSFIGFGFASSTGLSRMLSILSNIYIFVIFGAFTAVYVCGDFGNATIKNIFTKGYSRTEVYFAKYIVCLIVSVAYALIAYLAAFILGSIFWSSGKNWEPKVILLLIIQLLAVAAFNAFFCFIAAWMKRVGSALALSIAIPIGLPLILSVIDLIINNENIQISKYWLGGAVRLVDNVSAPAGDIVLSCVLSLFYLAVFTVLGWLFARKREV